MAFAPDDLNALANWAAAQRPDRLDEIRGLAAAGIRLAVPMRTRDVADAIDASVIQGSAAGGPQTNARWSQMKTPSQPPASAASATLTPTRGSE